MTTVHLQQKDNAEWQDYPCELALPICVTSMWLRRHRLLCSFLSQNRKTIQNAQAPARLKSAPVARCSSHRCPNRRIRLLLRRATANRRQKDELAMPCSMESQRR